MYAFIIQDDDIKDKERKLQKLIEKRKKKKEKNTDQKENDSRKRKIDEEIEEEINNDEEVDIKKKKKKKKKRDDDDDDTKEETLLGEETEEKSTRNQYDEPNSNVGDEEVVGENESKDAGVVTGTESDAKKKDDAFFPVLGKLHHAPKVHAKRTLPRWLAQPRKMATNLKDSDIQVKDIDFLSENSKRNLQTMEITRLFPVQSHVIPVVLEMFSRRKPCFPCRDILVQSPTGSGKTLSYVLPIVDRMSSNIIRDLQCLVVLPTKDLAVQVKKTFDMCVVGTNLKVGLAAGIKSFPKEQESLVISR